MRLFAAPSRWAMLGLMGVLAAAHQAAGVEPFGSASLLPMPSVAAPAESYRPISPASFGGSFQEEIPGPSDIAPPFAPPPPGLSQDYQNAMKHSWDGAGYGDCAPCGDAGCCLGRPCPHFYVYGGGLVMGRSNQCARGLTHSAYDTILTTNDASQDWAGGFEARAGWIMPNCCNAFEVGYWGLFPDSQSAYVNAPNYPNPIYPLLGNHLDQLFYDDGQGNVRDVNTWMSSSTGTHWITRSYDFHSLEFNFLGNTYAWGVVPLGAGCGNCNGCLPCGRCGPARWQFGWLAGFRYFQFNEALLFQTDYNDTYINGTDDWDELRYFIDVNNTLLGFQMGGQGAWYVTKCWSIYGGGRFGVFNNHIEATQYIAGQYGDATYNGVPFRYTSDQDSLAALGQIDLGLRYQAGCHWSFTGGYRVVGIAGVATGPSQIADNFADPWQARRICADDSVILHGAYLGGQFAW